MSQSAIFGPFLAMLLLTFMVWTYMFFRRIHFFQANGIQPADLDSPEALAQISTPAISLPSDNLKNLFELPVLFYALVLYLFAVEQVDTVSVAAAWVFVAFRALHSAVHCTFNAVMLRFNLYLVSSLALWLLAGRAAWRYWAG